MKFFSLPAIVIGCLTSVFAIASTESAMNDVTLLPAGSKIIISEDNFKLKSTTDLVIVSKGSLIETSEKEIKSKDGDIIQKLDSLKGEPTCLFFGLTEEKIQRAKYQLFHIGNTLFGWGYLTQFQDNIFLACRSAADLQVEFPGRLKIYASDDSFPLVKISEISEILKGFAVIERSELVEMKSVINDQDKVKLTFLKDLVIPGGYPFYLLSDRAEMISGLGLNFLKHKFYDRISQENSKIICGIAFAYPLKQDIKIPAGTEFSVNADADVGKTFIPKVLMREGSGYFSNSVNLVCYKKTGFMASTQAVPLSMISEFVKDTIKIESED